ncbi:hypothetical protein B7R54_06630 [Subtercola boreus]|uniref:SseB protein N-terminal domain-containing protein n=1 Tax=Subtercola boreus TaxID=120213 RepID=A0A3E0VJA4_9MICO|nr:SseB family protein [Subtercola boreus]RFA08937.1 hypothetical protein B7R54_06630 [Subtercola boreus]TQL54078.1 type III secretion system (T3SS) SseB-like protein [Subtercola boreus]
MTDALTPADSAGQPWAGRTFDAHPTTFAGDDGAAPELLVAALNRFHELVASQPTAGSIADLLAAQTAVVDAVRDVRLLVPLLAHAGETGVDDHGRTVDKTQELSIVTVTAPDGRAVQPAFTSTEAMARWNPKARPIPTPARRVALAAAGESTDLIILDPTSPTEFALRRPAVWAIAQATPWVSPLGDTAVARAFAGSAAGERDIQSIRLRAGDPSARLVGTEVIVELTLVPGLDRDRLAALLAALQQRWAESEVIAGAVDSMSLKLLQGS